MSLYWRVDGCQPDKLNESLCIAPRSGAFGIGKAEAGRAQISLNNVEVGGVKLKSIGRIRVAFCRRLSEHLSSNVWAKEP